jgi:antitoxin component of RelBE/YafQ-DinJ toxin-antitoxin module
MFLLLDHAGRVVPQCGLMKVKKDREIKARVDSGTKAALWQLAYLHGLDVSDLIREAIRDLLLKHPLPLATGR